MTEHDEGNNMSHSGENNAAGGAGGLGRWAELARAAAEQRSDNATDAAPDQLNQVDQDPEADEIPEVDVIPEVDQAAHAGQAAHVDQVAEHADRAEQASEAAESRRRAAGKRRFFSRLPTSDEQEAAPAPSTRNPLLPSTDDGMPLVDEDAGDGGSGLARLGLGHVSGPTEPPVAPAPLNPAVTRPAQWPPARADRGNAAVQVVGLHGGAGASTMAALLGPEGQDCGTGLDGLVSATVPVLFVTRSHARGLALALRLGQQFAARDLDPLPVLGICVVYDAPTLSKGLARTLKSVQKTLPNCWTVPWDEDLRHDPALPQSAARGRLARDLRRIVKRAEQLREERSKSANEDRREAR